MDMPKLLIADTSDEFRQILFDDLCSHYIIKTCKDGLQAMALLRSFQPDLMVLDLMLPGLDGISLLQRAQDEGICPASLVFCPYPSEYIASALHRLGVAYPMYKPCDLQAIQDRLADLAADLQPDALPQANINSAACNILLDLNFAARWDGFLFLQAGIPIYMNDPGQSMTKELYVTIGERYGKGSAQVERSIRSAIDKAWQNRDDRIWQQFFNTAGGYVPRPSNNEFFARIATALSKQGYGTKYA